MFPSLVQFVRRVRTMPFVVRWFTDSENVTLSFRKITVARLIMSGIGNVIQIDYRNKPKTQGFMGACDSQQLMAGKPDRRKWSESKPQSGMMLIFIFSSCVPNWFEHQRPQHTAEFSGPVSTSANIANLAGWQVTKSLSNNWATCESTWLLFTSSGWLGSAQSETKYQHSGMESLSLLGVITHGPPLG